MITKDKMSEENFVLFIKDIQEESGIEINPDKLLNSLDPLKHQVIYFSPCIDLLSTYFFKQNDEESVSLIQTINETNK